MKRVLPTLFTPDQVLEALSNREAIYVIYENWKNLDRTSIEEEVLLRKKLFRKKTLTLSRLVRKDRASDPGSVR